jgi:hypothetical protein
MADVSYILSKTIYNLYNKKSTTITLKDIKNPTKFSGSKVIKGKLTKKYYYTLSKNIVSYVDKNKKTPSYGTTPLGKIPFPSIVDGFSKVVSYHQSKKVLPAYVSYNTKLTSSLNKYVPNFNGKKGITVSSSSSNTNSNSNINNSSNGNSSSNPNVSNNGSLNYSKVHLDNKNGVWLFAGDMLKVDFKLISSYGIKNVFLNEYAFTLYSNSVIKSWITNGSKYGVKTHIWVQTFYSNGKWVNPINTTTGKINQNYF